MYKKINGYFTIEASCIVPLVLFWYLLILLLALFFYSQSSISQDSYLLGMRASRFTYGEDYYGEVIYGDTSKAKWDAKAYVIERIQRKSSFYPAMEIRKQMCEITPSEVSVYVEGKGMRKGIRKICQVYNPITVIREERKRRK